MSMTSRPRSRERARSASLLRQARPQPSRSCALDTCARRKARTPHARALPNPQSDPSRTDSLRAGDSMEGSQDPNDNPVSIQVVPMVDIIFCLCVFFMCSMKWKELEGKFESWLPKDMGQDRRMDVATPIEEIRVALSWDEAKQTTVRKFGATTVRDDTQLQELIRDSYAGW